MILLPSGMVSSLYSFTPRAYPSPFSQVIHTVRDVPLVGERTGLYAISKLLKFSENHAMVSGSSITHVVESISAQTAMRTGSE